MTDPSGVALLPLFIPSPSSNTWSLFGFPIRAYALCIMAGIVAGVWLAARRWKARGGNAETIESAALLGVPLGIIGARLYHVVTDYQLYFGPGRHPVDALKIWNGGLGIWGGVAFGVLGALIVAHRRGASFPAIADACAPGILLAQGIGRLGNWFNSELFGGPTTLPWALEIDAAHRPVGFEQYATFHPTFLYEMVWNFAMVGVLLWADRRFTLGRGKVFTLYVVLYTAGRFWIEALRIDTVNEIGGFRLNNYTSAIVFVAAVAFLVYLVLNRPGRETAVDSTAVQPRSPELAAATPTTTPAATPAATPSATPPATTVPATPGAAPQDAAAEVPAAEVPAAEGVPAGRRTDVAADGPRRVDDQPGRVDDQPGRVDDQPGRVDDQPVAGPAGSRPAKPGPAGGA